MTQLPVILLTSLLFVLQACTSMGQVGNESAGPQEGESIIVLGVTSANYRVLMFSGTISGNNFRQTSGPATVAGSAQDGFLVARVAPGQSLGITVIEFLDKPSQVFGKAFYACRDARAMVFEVPQRGIYYLGHMDYRVEGQTLRIARNEQLDATRSHLRQHFPNLTVEVKVLDSRLLTTSGGLCSQTIIIPIYVGR